MKYYYQVEGGIRNNIGDVLQGIVAKAFLPPNNAHVADREALADIDKSEEALLIANGWYMHSYEKFPPPPNVKPVYVSMHIAKSSLLSSKKVRDHFKQHAPIGCRDQKTLKLFLGWGIPAYYSGCLTTTTRQRAPINNTGTGEVLLVDNIDHQVPQNVVDKLEQLLGTKLVRISHDPEDTSGNIEEYSARCEKHMDYLLERYCKARLIITTKIHCALPCLGMGANVMLIHPHPSEKRLAPVAELAHITSYEEVLSATELVKPPVKTEALKARQEFLSNICRGSVAKGYNVMQNPDSEEFKKVKRDSIRQAKLYGMAVSGMLKLGLANDTMKKVYGNSI
ncbi:polysaccharide pyruvyl transferase family protein [Mucilaginibacter lacusdianchii]|uniref:polysaccharide pyruvyl transferase family protein n=1 Tax=Mucilaginibacter lacusdianchii TaxID=2684211 RepID=UPI00131ECC4C|nr:polysaccharide pyruvyl transferase family protein [Mucilaginibacter sp. JXJ CY 39]